MYHDLIIIGGGPCGVASAIKAKDLNIDIGLIDGNDRICKKLLTTGNGRCNITNEKIELSRYHSDNNLFFKDIIVDYNYDETIKFLNSIGIYTCTLENDKVFPISLQASAVVDLLRLNLVERDIPIYLDNKVISIKKDKSGLFKITTIANEFTCKTLLLCTGGKSYPKLGSDGSGYKLAKGLGHSIITPVPGIVQLKLNYSKLKAISGVKFTSSCNIIVDGKVERSEYGEILFTDYGISGPPILQLSRIASKGILNKKSVYIEVNLTDSTYEKISESLETHFAIFSHRTIYDNLVGLLNKKLIPIVLKEVGIYDIHTPTYNIDYDLRYRLYTLLSQWKFEVVDTNSFNNAQVTVGGVNTIEIDPKTLQSKLVSGLFFGGEILDVDGDCGGFNLQWCWSSSDAVIHGILDFLHNHM